MVNSVEPHYFAGYTGGRKSIFPGLAGYDTVYANHRLSMEPGSETLRLEGNPIHEDLEEALEVGIAGKNVYSIQMVLDKAHESASPRQDPWTDPFARPSRSPSGSSSST